MKRAAGLLLALFVVLTPSIGHAGGWAVASLDPLPPISAGGNAPIGFRLLQHGVTPVVAAEWPGAEIGIAVRDASDPTEAAFVAAEPAGDPGHYVATIAVPAGASTVEIQVQMRNGLLVSDAWINLPIASTVSRAGVGGGRDDGWLPTWTVPLFALAAVGCAAVMLVDRRESRRRRAERAGQAVV